MANLEQRITALEEHVVTGDFDLSDLTHEELSALTLEERERLVVLAKKAGMQRDGKFSPAGVRSLDYVELDALREMLRKMARVTG